MTALCKRSTSSSLLSSQLPEYFATLVSQLTPLQYWLHLACTVSRIFCFTFSCTATLKHFHNFAESVTFTTSLLHFHIQLHNICHYFFCHCLTLQTTGSNCARTIDIQRSRPHSVSDYCSTDKFSTSHNFCFTTSLSQLWPRHKFTGSHSLHLDSFTPATWCSQLPFQKFTISFSQLRQFSQNLLLKF